MAITIGIDRTHYDQCQQCGREDLNRQALQLVVTDDNIMYPTISFTLCQPCMVKLAADILRELD